MDQVLAALSAMRVGFVAQGGGAPAAGGRGAVRGRVPLCARGAAGAPLPDRFSLRGGVGVRSSAPGPIGAPWPSWGATRLGTR